jgi:hypothetical protein
MSEISTYVERAVDECRIGGNVEKAKVYATLALAEALSDLVREIAGLGTEASPIHTYEMAAGGQG